ncbi:Deoxycytidylate deaminase, partial [Fragariocoptes setiger]
MDKPLEQQTALPGDYSSTSHGSIDVEGVIVPFKNMRTVTRRSDNLGWVDYFMAVACLTAQRSKDPSTQVGACIVDQQNKIVGVGYNGLPRGLDDDLMPWEKEGDFIKTKYAYIVHAELNAILNCIKTDQRDCTLYVSHFPCNECAKCIIQSGIKKIFYLSDKHHERETTKASKIMFKMAGVKCEQYLPSMSCVTQESDGSMVLNLAIRI